MSPTSWKWLAYALAGFSVVLWAVASLTGWINSVAFVSHVSMGTAVVTFMAMARADAPDEGKEDE